MCVGFYIMLKASVYVLYYKRVPIRDTPVSSNIYIEKKCVSSFYSSNFLEREYDTSICS